MEFYNSDIDMKVIFDDTNKSVTQKCTVTNEEFTAQLENSDFEEMVTFMQIPGFGWGTALVKLAIAVSKKLSGGSSAS